jgi:single-stranded DNA-binding protein
MAFHNSVNLMGYAYSLKKIETKTGKPMCIFNILIIDKFGETEKKSFIKCVAYSKIAEVIMNNFHDKINLFVDGRIEVYKDESGAERVQIVVNNFQFLGDKAA